MLEFTTYRTLVTASFLAASCSNCVSTSSPGSCTYRTTEPRMKQFFTDSICGYFSGSVTLISVSFMLRYWSTECSVPQILRSFFSSTTTSFPTRDLKKE
uniref:Putative secreted protein n=1 Tax=Anopheles marajoara TaxID=58244 RepID=A0A2M4C952_9DIPT